MRSLRISCVQTNSGADIEANIEQTSGLIRMAHAKGAQLIALPEMVGAIDEQGEKNIANALAQDEHPALKAYQPLARELSCWIHVGSLSVKHETEDLLANRSFLLSDQGEIVATYDKIHLFDVDVPGEKPFRESARYHPGSEAVIADTPFGKIGFAVCYDLRFPQLFRTLAQEGAEIIMMPAAFTKTTGEAHWHSLLRARAIETGCYIIAPAQTGDHPGDRQTFGHSLVVGPWGEVRLDGGEDVGVTSVTVDLNRVQEVRQQLPSLQHDRDFVVRNY